MRDMLRLGAILGLFCAIAGASLAVVHGITSDIIVQREEAEIKKQLQVLLPAAERFETVESEILDTYYLGYSGNTLTGAVLTGSTKGYRGDLRLLVAVNEQGNIAGIQVIEHNETMGIGTNALEDSYLSQFYGQNYETQFAGGKNIDMVTGATVTSRAIIVAVENALELYRNEVLGLETEDTWDLSNVADGTYEGIAPGFKDDIQVSVTVLDGKITDIQITSINDTADIYPDAVAGIPPRIIEKQHWQVDAVSGATASSKGIMEAVKAALAR